MYSIKLKWILKTNKRSGVHAEVEIHIMLNSRRKKFRNLLQIYSIVLYRKNKNYYIDHRKVGLIQFYFSFTIICLEAVAFYFIFIFLLFQGYYPEEYGRQLLCEHFLYLYVSLSCKVHKYMFVVMIKIW